MVVAFNFPNCFPNGTIQHELIFNENVFIPFALLQRVCRICECVGHGQERGFETRRGSKINYETLALGHLPEVRHLFARIVFDT
ncbi:hypothetical protein RJ641_002549, partial [Dillenia turbinata]